MDRLTLLPCPFCGHQSDDLDILEGSTFRWRIGSCKGCGATTGEERIQTSGEGSSAEWEQNCKERINKSWNRRQSLSQEAVRDEALEEAASVDQREVELRGWREAIRVLKRDPNAAAESYESAHPKALDEPAPAAPDVASMVKRLRNCCTMIGYATSGAERTSHKRNADDAEAALLTRLGQGWIPVSRTAEYQEHHFKVEDVGVAWNGNRVWVCADSGALLRAKVIGEKLFVEFTPPAP